MKKLTATLLIAIFSLGLAGCRTDGSMDKQTAGAILGGIAGGLLGSRVGKGRGRHVATIAGAVLGSLAGSSIGRQLDVRDRLLMLQSTQTTLAGGMTNVAGKWVNPDTGNRGTITPRAPLPGPEEAPPPAIAASSSRPSPWAARQSAPTAGPADSPTVAGR